ncbi:hypothetical protein TIFTF001_030347 [Ficus carica]|uniref:Uncharacterized protein n=1 Tax=Ficus carica TaxID=3494 RepID=A0AA88DT58_FICCA|nr:hypothetical protein TIFTF001_030347 [Ficus carica]
MEELPLDRDRPASSLAFLLWPYCPPLVGVISSSKTSFVPELSIETSGSTYGVLPSRIVIDPNPEAPAA